MEWTLRILGSNSALPKYGRNLSSQLLKCGSHQLLFDCGEATQFQLSKFKEKPFKIDAIFISHLHGDHFFGLFGLLSSMHMLGRQKPIHIFAFPALEPLLSEVFLATNTQLNFEIIFHPLKSDVFQKIIDFDDLEVYSFPLSHSVESCGFLVQSKRGSRRIKKDFVSQHHIPIKAFESIKNGQDFTDAHGKLYKNEEITLDPHDIKSYAYCSDTQYFSEVIQYIKGVDLLYHESTFLDHEKEDAQKKKHSTASQAATIAYEAKVSKLLLGHFSSRYEDVSLFFEEAQAIFHNVECAEDGKEIIF